MKRKRLLLIGIPVVLLGLLILWPLPKSLVDPQSHEPQRILDRNGELLYEVRDPEHGAQKEIPLKQIPKTIVDALIATEDRTFRSHMGVSIRGISRAFVQNFQAGKIVSGGSTITQQLVRTRLQPKRRGYFYKALEAYLALRLDAKLSKDQILEDYLNESYFGHQAYGIVAAADTYFGKSLGELSQAESAYLVGLLQAPSSFDPFENPKLAKERQETVLQSLLDASVIDQPTHDRLQSEPITLTVDRTDIRAPHFVFWLLNNYKEEIEGLDEVTTTLDLGLQTEAEDSVRRRVADLRDHNVTSAAVVVLDAKTGEILAMVGSADYFDTENDGAVNVATAARQPGSALKPFTYALAMAQGATAASTVADIETQFFTQEGNPYVPRNYDYGYHGLVRFRDALANSYNIAAVKVLEKVGVPNLVVFLKNAGLSTLNESPDHYGLALTLGDAEVKLLELAAAYAIFPRGGLALIATPMFPVPELPSSPLPTEASAKAGVPEQILDPKIAWLISDILSDQEARLPEFGVDSPLNFTRPVAAKTGTTRNSRDNWTVGFTNERIVGVWVGNADNTPMKDTSGVTGAGPIFHDVMEEALNGIPPTDFPQPSGFVQKSICRISGKLPTPLCPHTIEEWFIAGTEPRDPDDLFQEIAIDTRTNLKANDDCPDAFIEKKVFAIFPPELRTWARENGWEIPPATFSPLCRAETKDPETGSFVTIEKPSPNDSFDLDPLIPNANEKIIFTARADEDLQTAEWFVNGEKVGEGRAPSFRFEWLPTVGSHVIKIVGKDVQDERRISVKE